MGGGVDFDAELAGTVLGFIVAAIVAGVRWYRRLRMLELQVTRTRGHLHRIQQSLPPAARAELEDLERMDRDTPAETPRGRR